MAALQRVRDLLEKPQPDRVEVSEAITDMLVQANQTPDGNRSDPFFQVWSMLRDHGWFRAPLPPDSLRLLGALGARLDAEGVRIPLPDGVAGLPGAAEWTADSLAELSSLWRAASARPADDGAAVQAARGLFACLRQQAAQFRSAVAVDAPLAGAWWIQQLDCYRSYANLEADAPFMPCADGVDRADDRRYQDDMNEYNAVMMELFARLETRTPAFDDFVRTLAPGRRDDAGGLLKYWAAHDPWVMGRLLETKLSFSFRSECPEPGGALPAPNGLDQMIAVIGPRRVGKTSFLHASAELKCGPAPAMQVPWLHIQSFKWIKRQVDAVPDRNAGDEKLDESMEWWRRGAPDTTRSYTRTRELCGFTDMAGLNRFVFDDIPGEYLRAGMRQNLRNRLTFYPPAAFLFLYNPSPDPRSPIDRALEALRLLVSRSTAPNEWNDRAGNALNAVRGLFPNGPVAVAADGGLRALADELIPPPRNPPAAAPGVNADEAAKLFVMAAAVEEAMRRQEIPFPACVPLPRAIPPHYPDPAYIPANNPPGAPYVLPRSIFAAAYAGGQAAAALAPELDTDKWMGDSAWLVRQIVGGSEKDDFDYARNNAPNDDWARSEAGWLALVHARCNAEWAGKWVDSHLKNPAAPPAEAIQSADAAWKAARDEYNGYKTMAKWLAENASNPDVPALIAHTKRNFILHNLPGGVRERMERAWNDSFAAAWRGLPPDVAPQSARDLWKAMANTAAIAGHPDIAGSVMDLMAAAQPVLDALLRKKMRNITFHHVECRARQPFDQPGVPGPDRRGLAGLWRRLTSSLAERTLESRKKYVEAMADRVKQAFTDPGPVVAEALTDPSVEKEIRAICGAIPLSLYNSFNHYANQAFDGKGQVRPRRPHFAPDLAPEQRPHPPANLLAKYMSLRKGVVGWLRRRRNVDAELSRLDPRYGLPARVVALFAAELKSCRDRLEGAIEQTSRLLAIPEEAGPFVPGGPVDHHADVFSVGIQVTDCPFRDRGHFHDADGRFAPHANPRNLTEDESVFIGLLNGQGDNPRRLIRHLAETNGVAAALAAARLFEGSDSRDPDALLFYRQRSESYVPKTLILQNVSGSFEDQQTRAFAILEKLLRAWRGLNECPEADWWLRLWQAKYIYAVLRQSDPPNDSPLAGARFDWTQILNNPGIPGHLSIWAGAIIVTRATTPEQLLAMGNPPQALAAFVTIPAALNRGNFKAFRSRLSQMQRLAERLVHLMNPGLKDAVPVTAEEIGKPLPPLEIDLPAKEELEDLTRKRRLLLLSECAARLLKTGWAMNVPMNPGPEIILEEGSLDPFVVPAMPLEDATLNWAPDNLNTICDTVNVGNSLLPVFVAAGYPPPAAGDEYYCAAFNWRGFAAALRHIARDDALWRLPEGMIVVPHADNAAG